MTNSDIDALCKRLELIAAWRKPGGPTPKMPQPNTHKNCLEARTTILALRDQLAKAEVALRPFVEGASHTMVFLRSREKMHPAGQQLYTEDVDRARAYFAAQEPTT